MQTDPFRKRLTTFSAGLSRTACSFVCDFIALEIMESEVAFHGDNFCKFHVPYATQRHMTAHAPLFSRVSSSAVCEWTLEGQNETFFPPNFKPSMDENKLYYL